MMALRAIDDFELWLRACRLACAATGADLRKVLALPGKVGRGSDALTTRARKLACWISVRCTQSSSRQLGEAIGLHHSTLRQHASEVEREGQWRLLAKVAA